MVWHLINWIMKIESGGRDHIDDCLNCNLSINIHNILCTIFWWYWDLFCIQCCNTITHRIRIFFNFFFTFHITTELAAMNPKAQGQSDCRSWFDDNGLSMCIVEQTSTIGFSDFNSDKILFAWLNSWFNQFICCWFTN